MNKRSTSSRLLRALAVLIVLSFFFFLIVPIIIVIPMSFSSALSLQFPPPSYSMEWYRRFFGDRSWIEAAIMSFRVGILAAVLSTALGTPAAYALFRYDFRGKQVIRSLLVAPLVTPLIVIGVALLLMFAPLRIVANPWALTAAHAAIAIPYVVVLVDASLRQFDPALQRAALSLGASPWRAFRRVVLPLNLPGIIAGALFAFVFSFGEIVVSIFISGRGSVTLPKKIWDGVLLEVDPTISVVTTLMVLLTLVMLALSALVRRKGPT